MAIFSAGEKIMRRTVHHPKGVAVASVLVALLAATTVCMAGALPSNISSWESGYFDDKPLIKVFGDQMRHTKSPPNIPEWEEIASMINQRTEEVMLEEISIQEMQNTLNRDIEDILIVEEKGSGNVRFTGSSQQP